MQLTNLKIEFLGDDLVIDVDPVGDWGADGEYIKGSAPWIENRLRGINHARSENDPVVTEKDHSFTIKLDGDANTVMLVLSDIQNTGASYDFTEDSHRDYCRLMGRYYHRLAEACSGKVFWCPPTSVGDLRIDVTPREGQAYAYTRLYKLIEEAIQGDRLMGISAQSLDGDLYINGRLS